MPDETLVVKGYRELIRSLTTADKETRKVVRVTIRHAGESVQQEARSRLIARRPNDTRTATGYKIRVRQRGLFVEQSLRKTTGLHPEWGAYQMRHALVPALITEAPETKAAVEHAMVEVCAAVNRTGEML